MTNLFELPQLLNLNGQLVDPSGPDSGGGNTCSNGSGALPDDAD